MKLKLTAENVELVFTNCLFRDGEDTSHAVIAEVVMNKFGFHPERLLRYALEIKQMLSDLPSEFQADQGGGTSFLAACMTSDGRQWGEHRNIDQLLALGIATGQARILLPREAWSVLPGGMPYFVIGGTRDTASHDAWRVVAGTERVHNPEIGEGEET